MATATRDFAHVRPVHLPRPPLAPIVHVMVAATTILPFLWILLLSLKTRREFVNDPFGLPAQPSLANYAAVFSENTLWSFLGNSLFVVSAALTIVLIAAVPAAYALAKVSFRGRDGLFLLFLVADSIPLIAIIIPLFILVQMIGLGSSRFAIVFAFAAMNMGVTIYILRSFFRSIPSEIEDAARLDGCNLIGVVRHVVLPIARPGLLVVTVTNFIAFWNEYFLATVLASSQAQFTLPAGLAATLVNKHETNWPVMAAAVVLMLVPVLTLFLAFQDRIVNAWATSQR